MPDQIPSAILDSSNSFDSLFALDLDTKQRFDNITNREQKPIDYPLPDYQKDMTPQGLSQEDLLNPTKTAGSIGEGLFSSDPKIAAYATDKLRGVQSNLPIAHGIGVPDRFSYSKEMNKYLNGDFGYNPYQSLEDNEDFNYRYDYMNQGLVERIFKNVGTGISRFVGSVGLKLVQTAGYMGSMVFNGIEEMFNSKNNNFMADVADNSLSRWTEGLEQDMKDSNMLSVFKPKGWEDKGFFAKLRNGAFWTDEVADGAAFMGEMVASMYLLGGLGKIGAIGKLGQTEINLTKALSKFGQVGKYGGKGIDAILKTATGADNLSGIGRWAFATTSESAFEAAGLYTQKKDQLRADRTAGINTYSDAEIETMAGNSAAASFKANMLILSASNAFENRFIFSPLFKRWGINDNTSKSRLIGVSESTENIDKLAKATRKEYSYLTKLGKKLDLKNPNGRARFYGTRGLKATVAEGFWEENAQLAVERLAASDHLNFNKFMKQIGQQTLDAVSGNDPEASTSIGLGAVIGIGGTSAVSKLAGGNKYTYATDGNLNFIKDAEGNYTKVKKPFMQRGERRQIESDTDRTIQIYEKYRKAFLNYQDIYVTDKAGKPIMDSDGNMQIDDVKAAGMFDGTNKFLSKQQAISKISDPLFRKQLQDDALSDYVVAAKMAGIYKNTVKRFTNLNVVDEEQLKTLGFDPNTTVDSVYMKDSLVKFGEIYDSTQKSSSEIKKGQTQEDDDARKLALYKASTGVYSATKLIGEFQSKMLDRDFPSVFSPEAEGNTSEVQQYNSLVYQLSAIENFEILANDNGSFYDGYIKAEKRRITEEKDRIEKNMADGELSNPNASDIRLGKNGLLFSPAKYEGMSQEEITLSQDIEDGSLRKHAEYTNIRSQNQYLANKFGNPVDGNSNYQEYKEFLDSIHKKDKAQDDKTDPPKAGPVDPNTVPPPAAPPVNKPPVQVVNPMTRSQAMEGNEVLVKLTKILDEDFETFKKEDPNDILDYGGLADYINTQFLLHPEVVKKVIMDFLRITGDNLLSEIAANTFKSDNLNVEKFSDTIKFIENLMSYVDNEDFVNEVYAYIDEVTNKLENYVEPVIELTDAENNALALIQAIPNISTGMLSEYAKVLLDTNSSKQDIKNALKAISDQLLDPNTTAEVGEILGGQASIAIENLGYQAPVPVNIQGSGAPVINPIDTLREKAIALQAFIERVVAGESMTSPEDLEYYDNNKAEIEAELRKRAASPTGTPEDISQPISLDPNLPKDYKGPLKVGDKVVVGTKKDGVSVIKELRGDKALLEDGRTVSLNNLTLEQPTLFDEPPIPPVEPPTEDDNTEGSGKKEPPKLPPPPPPNAPENSDAEFVKNNNYIDEKVDFSKIKGIFTFVGNSPQEIVMENGVAKIVDGAIQLFTTQGDQQLQIRRQHLIINRMSNKSNSINFWSEDPDGNKMFKIKLEIAGVRNEAKYAPFVHNTAKGITNPKTGKLYPFPFIVAMVTNSQGDYIYFTDEGEITTNKLKGKPFGFFYNAKDYETNNLNISRRGVQLGSGEPLNGRNGYSSENPLEDIKNAIYAGVPVLGDIDTVTSGKLSTFNVDNSGSTYAKLPQQRTVKEMIEAGDVTDDAPVVLTTGEYFEYSASTQEGAPQQQIKVGQPYLIDEKTGMKIPLKGKKIKDLTIGGKPLITGRIKEFIEELQSKGKISLDPTEATDAQTDKIFELFNFLRALVYSRNTPVFINESKTEIRILDQRPDNIPLMETEVNFSTSIESMANPLDETSEGFSYQDFIKENFLSGVVPVEVTKGQKTIEKLNRRIIFVLDKSHTEILDSIGAQPTKQPIRMPSADFSKFVNKTFRKRGGTETVTITGLTDGKFTIVGKGGEVTQSTDDFIKSLRNLEEVTLPAVTDEVQEDFDKQVSFTEAKEKELNEKAKNMTQEDIDNLNFDC